jgi:hypothetical protein
MVDSCFEQTPFARTEAFESVNGIQPAASRMLLVSIITLGLMITALLFVGKYLWNNVLVQLISFAKPVRSVWQLVGLSILLSLIAPGCRCM